MRISRPVGRLRSHAVVTAVPAGSRRRPISCWALSRTAQTSHLAELRERLIEERGETFAISTVHGFYRRHGITFKKRPAHASEQEREDVRARREAWFEAQPDLDPAQA